jgi:hypothetical protein
MSQTRQSTPNLAIDPDLDVPSGSEAEVLATATAAAVLPPSTPPRPRPTWASIPGSSGRNKRVHSPHESREGDVEGLETDEERE